MIPAANTEYEGPLHVVQIHFDTATYDEIERDVKVTMEALLGLIGGTMGLFCGFSVFSMLEIIYCIIKQIMYFISNKSDRLYMRIKVHTNTG